MSTTTAWKEITRTVYDLINNDPVLKTNLTALVVKTYRDHPETKKGDPEDLVQHHAGGQMRRAIMELVQDKGLKMPDTTIDRIRWQMLDYAGVVVEWNRIAVALRLQDEKKG